MSDARHPVDYENPFFSNEEKAKLKKEYLSTITDMLNRLSDSSVASVLNTREGLYKDDVKRVRVSSDEVTNVLCAFDAKDPGYSYDPRIRTSMLQIGFSEKEINALKVSDLLVYEAVIFAVGGLCTKLIFQILSDLSNNDEMDPDELHRAQTDLVELNKSLPSLAAPLIREQIAKKFPIIDRLAAYQMENNPLAYEKKFTEKKYEKDVSIPEQATVLNLVMLGTGENQGGKPGLLSNFAAAINQTDKQYVHLINGVGGVAKSDQEDNPMVGTYDVTVNFDEQTQKLSVTKKIRSAFKSVSRLAALVAGTGYKDAINEALAVIDKLIKAGKKPLVLNLYGFSRGADTMLRLSNIIAKKYPNEDITINILDIDPVPGLGRRSAPNARYIPKQVKHYESILMEDEKRVEFTAQDRLRLIVADVNLTKIKHYFLRGYHGFATRITSAPTDKASKSDSAHLLWDILQRFAYQHGTKLNPQFIPYFDKAGQSDQTIDTRLNPAQRLMAYNSMTVDLAMYKGMSRNQYLPMSRNRGFYHTRKYYFFHGHDVFRDQAHMMLFKDHYPAIFDYYFQNNLDKKPLQALQDEVDKIHNKLEDIDASTYELLSSSRLASIIKKEVPLGPPQGIDLTVDEVEDPEFKRLWETIQNQFLGVLVGFNAHVSEQQATNFLDKAYKVMVSRMSIDEKYDQIEILSRRFMIEHKTNRIFESNLMASFSTDGIDPLTEAIRYLEDLHLQDGVAKDMAAADPLLATLNYYRKRKSELNNGKDKTFSQIKLYNDAIADIKQIKSHPQKNIILDYLKRERFRYRSYSLADMIIPMCRAAIMNSDYSTRLDSKIARHLIVFLQQINAHQHGNDAYLIREALQFAHQIGASEGGVESLFQSELTNFAFYHLTASGHFHELTPTLSNYLQQFKLEVHSATLQSELAFSHLQTDSKTSEAERDNHFKQFIEDANTYLKSSNVNAINDIKILNDMQNALNVKSSKVVDDVKDNKFDNVINSLLDNFRNVKQVNTFQFTPKKDFFNSRKRAPLYVDIIDHSGDDKAKITISQNQGDLAVGDLMQHEDLAWNAMVMVERVRSQVIEETGHANGFRVELDGIMNEEQVKNIVLYCDKNNYECVNNITRYKIPTQKEKDLFKQNLEIAKERFDRRYLLDSVNIHPHEIEHQLVQEDADIGQATEITHASNQWSGSFFKASNPEEPIVQDADSTTDNKYNP